MRILQLFAISAEARENKGMGKWLFLFLVAGIMISSAVAAAPEVFISSTNLLQADTLRVQVNTTSEVKGRLGSVPLRFYKSEDGLSRIALVGMPANKLPGKYALVVTENNKQIFRKIITVSKRKFPVTVLALTPQLKQKGYTASKIISNIKNQENITLNKALEIISSAPYSAKPFINPLQEIFIMGNYGDIRKSGVAKIQHLGVDLKAAVGTPVLAVNDGKVVFEATMPDYGNTLVIDHGLGVYSLYLHLSEFRAAVNDMVAQGQVVALSGDTGYVTGPHLHFSIKLRGSSIDPLIFIQTSNVK